MKHTPTQIKKELQKAYRDIADDFSETRSSAWPEFSLIARSIPDESTVLDLGCGNGRLYQYLKNEAGLKLDYTGLDFCPEFLAIAKERYPQADFVEGDLSHFDLDTRFDAIVSVAAFHHLPSKRMRQQCLKNIFEHLKDDGVLIVSVWNLWQWKYWPQHIAAFGLWLRSFFRRDLRGLMVPFGKKKIQRYYHAFFIFEMRRLLNKQAFQIEHFEISRHNFFFVCKKRMSKAQSQPIRNVAAKHARSMNPSHVATCK